MSSVTNNVRSTAKLKINKLINKSTLNNKNVTQSRQRLVSENSSASSDESIGNNKEEIIEANVHQTDKKYIMDKFLKASSVGEDSVKVKPPVPRPRSKKLDEERGTSDNSGTYTISPEHNKLELENKRENLKKSHSSSTYTKSIREDTPIKENIELVEFANGKNGHLLDEEIEDQENEVLQVFTDEKNIDDDNVFDYKNLINIIVHSSNRLELESCVIHPVVKIHVIDRSTETYLKKSDKNRNVMFYYENKNIDYIGPILTKTYNLQENRSIYPKWEETILVNEDFNYFKKNHNIILFFEIMDFLNFNQVNQENKGGWKNIAWAFLLLNSETYTNTNKKVRLQLYRPRKLYPKETCQVYNWWKNKKFHKYPSSLYITVESIEAPTKIVETLRSKTPLEIEIARNKMFYTKPAVSKVEETDIWNLSNDIKVCKVPNSLLIKLDTYEHGCYYIKFSNSGKLLARAVSDEADYTIIIYSILENTDLYHLNAHRALIYNIVWSKDDQILISASADCTICVWDTSNNFILVQVLSHPNFVYSCDIRQNIIVSGCYDNYVRIWTLNQDEEFKLFGEYEGHNSYVTSTCFNKEGNIFYSADSVGIILGWKTKNNKWTIRREIKILDLRETIIDQIILLKNERRLIVNSRDNLIRLIDIKTGFVLKVYSGALNNRYHINCCLTPCETYLFCGSENGELHVWSTDTGKVQHFFKPFDLEVTVHCVHYSFSNNLLGVSHYGNNNLPVLIYQHVECKKKVEEDRNIIINKFHEDPISKSIDGEKGPNFRKILEKMDDIMSQSSLST